MTDMFVKTPLRLIAKAALHHFVLSGRHKLVGGEVSFSSLIRVPYFTACKAAVKAYNI